MRGTARVAISAVFAVNGFGIGIWAAFIPIIKDRLALNDATLAVILFCAATGAIVAMPACGALADRFGSARAIVYSGTLFGVALGIASGAPSLAFAASAALAMGAGNGAMDVAMNVNGVTLQARSDRPIMSSLHGLFSLGTFAAAGAMAALLTARLPQYIAGIAVAALIVATCAIVRSLLVRETTHPAVAPGAGRSRIPPRLVLLGIAAVCSAVCEGTLVEWSGVYMRDSLHVGISAALGGFAAYATGMSTSRFCGDAIVRRVGPVALVRAGGMLGAAGLALALGVHTYAAVIAGFVIFGLGVGNNSPLVYGAGGEGGATGAGAGVAVVTTLGYSGFLIGPALIGLTAQRTSIDVAFGIVAIFSAAVGLLAPALRPRR